MLIIVRVAAMTIRSIRKFPSFSAGFDVLLKSAATMPAAQIKSDIIRLVFVGL